MRQPTKPLALFTALGLLFFTICACSVGGGSTGVATATPGTAATGTPSAPACATSGSATAEAWINSTDSKQVFGSIGGGAATQLSNFTYPLGLPNEGTYGGPSLSGLAIAPDGHHLAVMAGIYQDAAQTGYPYIVDTTTHAVTRVTMTQYPVGGSRRLLSWADNHTLIILTGVLNVFGSSDPAGTAQSYDITTNTLTPLPGVTNPLEGVVRCSTLFWLSYSDLTNIGSAEPPISRGKVALNRYDLSSHAAVGTAITLGDYRADAGCACGLTLNVPGWDASPDGSHIAYQQTTVASPSGTITSQFFAANADGSGAIQILHGSTPGAIATSNSGAFLAISPNGMQVAVTGAEPTPDIVSGSMSGGDAKSYTPDAGGIPAWLPDSSGFDAITGSSSSNISRYLLSTPGEPGDGRAPSSSTVATAAIGVVSLP